ncbi:MAG: hypothetical protein ACREBO_01300 [Novosphingobium sp.]
MSEAAAPTGPLAEIRVLDLSRVLAEELGLSAEEIARLKAAGAIG